MARPRKLGRVVEAIVALVLLAAALLKTHQMFAGTAPLLPGLLKSSTFKAFIIEAELLLAFWLLIGTFPQVRLVAAISCFTFFAAVSGYEAMRALPSCGCFGSVKIPPLATTIFDTCAVAALWFTRRSRGSQPPLRSGRAIFGICIALAASALLWSVYLLRPTPALGSTSPAATDGGLVVLDPSDWLNKPFPLFDEIDGAEELRAGRWLVVFYHYDCDTCRQAIPKYRALATGTENHADACRVAFIAMPPIAPPGEDPIPPSPDYLRLSLRPDHDWFATTPVVAAIDNGKVLSAADGEVALSPPSFSK